MSTTHRHASRLLVGLVPSLLLVAAGCGVSSANTSPADPESARQALRQALDAWKRGAAPSSAPAGVRVADDDWLAGAELIDYRLAGEGDVVGPYLRSPVVLTLRGPKGRPLNKTVVYDVTTGPDAGVIRHE